MNKYLTILFFFITTFLSAQSDITPQLTSESDMLSLIDGVVNVQNGKLVQIDKDIAIQGQDPLEIIRYYDGGYLIRTEWGCGMALSLPLLLVLDPERKTNNIVIEQRGSGYLLFNGVKHRTGRYTGKIDPEFLKSGYTNCCEALLNGEPDLCAMYVEGSEDDFVVSLGNGVKRHYEFFKRKKGSKIRLYRLKMEELATGNFRFYNYSGKKSISLSKVWTTNKDKNLTLNWLNFSHKKHHRLIEASNGQNVDYKVEKKKGKHCDGLVYSTYEMPLLTQVNGKYFLETQYDSIRKTTIPESLYTMTTVKNGLAAKNIINLTHESKPIVQSISNQFGKISGRGVTNGGVKLDLDILSKGGQVVDRGGLTKAGRALDKHGNRLNSPFPKATGNPASKNMQGQFHLDDILTHPNNKMIRGDKGDIRLYTPDGRGAHFRSDSSFKGFLNYE